MKFGELITIVLISLDWHPKCESEYIMVMEVLGADSTPDRFYFAELPVLNHRLKKQLRYYKQIMN